MRDNVLRIYIKKSNRKTIFIPAPIGLVKIALGFGNFGISVAKKYVPEEQRVYFENIDIQELSKSFDILKEYKGLKIVDVASPDGTLVKVII